MKKNNNLKNDIYTEELIKINFSLTDSKENLIRTGELLEIARI